jgi:hypothetical protein
LVAAVVTGRCRSLRRQYTECFDDSVKLPSCQPKQFFSELLAQQKSPTARSSGRTYCVRSPKTIPK